MIFISGLLKAQSNLYPDTLTRDSNLDFVLVLRDCFQCNPIEKDRPVQKYSFDKNGLNYKREGLDSLMQTSSRILFNYTNGLIESYENYSTYTSTPPDFEDFIWDSTARAQKVVYEFMDNTLNKIKWLEDNDRIDFDIIFEYNDANKVKRELHTEYSYPDVFKFQAFKPNSVAFLDSVKVSGNSTREKIYNYSKNACEIKYFVDSRQTGTESIKFNDFDKKTSREIYNMQGDTLLVEKFNYNLTGQLVERYLKETGYDAFGDSYDYLGYEKTRYEYDEKGRLMREEMYYKDKLLFVEKYKYIEK